MNLNENPLFQVSARGGFIPRAALTVAAVALCLTAGAAQAFTDKIRVDNTYYYIDYQDLSYDDDSETLENTAWWDNATLAEDLATASNEAATQATADNFGEALFLFSAVNSTAAAKGSGAGTESDVSGFGGSLSTDYTYATQAQAPTAVPEIDGVALSQGAFVTGALGLWLFGRRRAGAMP